MMDEKTRLEREEQWNLSQIRQRPSRLNPKRIGSVVRRLMTQSGYGQTQSANQLSEAWTNIVGEPLCNLTRPGKVTRGVLLVVTKSSGASQELTFRKRQVLAALNQKLPELNIRDLKARVQPDDV